MERDLGGGSARQMANEEPYLLPLPTLPCPVTMITGNQSQFWLFNVCSGKLACTASDSYLLTRLPSYQGFGFVLILRHFLYYSPILEEPCPVTQC